MGKIAFIMDELFEDSEFFVPYERAQQSGHEPVVVGLEAGKVLTGKKGAQATVDQAIDQVSASEFDGLVIPGGYSPDKLRVNEKMVEFTKSIFESKKPVAAICHAGWMLAEADVIKGRTLTSSPAIKTDLINAGAEWVDEEVFEDENLITSRRPDDLEAFSKAFLSQLEDQTIRSSSAQ